MKMSPRKQLQSGIMAYNAMMIGIILFLVISYVMNNFESNEFGSNEINPSMFFIFNAIAILGLVFGSLIYNLKLRALPKSIEAKVKLYTSISIVRGAFLEMGALLFIVGYYLTAERIYTVETFAVLIIMFVFRPSISKAKNAVYISENELDLTDPDE